MTRAERLSMVIASRLVGIGAVLLALAAPIAGVAYLVNEREEIIQEQSVELTALGRLRIDRVASWFDERLQDAQFVHRSKTVSADVARWLQSSPGPEQPDWMLSMYRNGQYRSIQIYSPEVRLLSSIPEANSTLHRDTTMIRLTLSTQSVQVDDLSKQYDGVVRLHVYVPLLRSASGNRTEAVGVVVFDIDPEDRLYPIIRSWPVPSNSAQSVLFRVAEDSVEYLDPRLRPDIAPLTLRLPTNLPHLPAARGAGGYQGIVDGIDYLGNPVIAYVAPIPRSPWLMVSKVDRSEILAPWSEECVVVGIASMFATLFAISVLVMGRRLAARELNEERIRHQSDLEAIRRHQSEITDLANDIVILSDGDDRILQVNRLASNVYGIETEQLAGRTVASLHADGASETYHQSLARLRRRGNLRYSAIHLAAGGRMIDVEISARHLVIDGRTYIQRIIRDVTERVAYESELRRLNRTRRVMSAVNRLITREQDEDRLIHGVCSIAVTEGGLPLVWIGRVNEEGTELVPRIAAGTAAPHASTIRIPLLPDSASPVCDGSLLLAGTPLVIDDLEKDARGMAWRDDARTYGLRSMAVLPVMVDGQLWGVVSFSAAEAYHFVRNELDLLEEIAADVAFALSTIQAQHHRQNAERLLAENQTIYRAMFENSGEAILLTKPEGTILSMNPEALRIFGRREEEIASLQRADLVDMTDPRLDPALEQRSRTGQFNGELRLKRADGSLFEGEVSSVIFHIRNGEPRTTMTIRDITERRASEQTMKSQLAELRRWHDLTLERETRVMELKREVNLLLIERGEAERYSSVGSQDESMHTNERPTVDLVS